MIMADEEYAKTKTQLDGVDEQEEQAIKNAVTKSKGSFASRLFNKGANAGANLVKGAADVGTKVTAGGLAAVQSVSATSLAVVLSTVLGLTSGMTGGDDYPVAYRDDASDDVYQCVDHYSEAYAGLFGSLDDQPLPDQDNNVLLRLKEINEWSKAYVGQSVPDSLVCDEPTCVFYGNTGCTDPDHPVKRVSNGEYTYYDTGGRIDLANVMRIHDFFREYGLTDVQIAAICGVMTIESRVDFTSLENYNISGERYNLDPSATTSEFGFKPWAEGLGSSPITTASCIHQISSNTYTGPDSGMDYASYASEHDAIWKLGIGIVGFTDGPGFQVNTCIRNYADYINDRVRLIQRLVEGTKGWQDDLRKRAADAYTYAYGAVGTSLRGTANNFDVAPSTAYDYKKAWKEYQKAEKELEEAVNEYNKLADEYVAAANAIRGNGWEYHSYTETPVSGDVTTAYHIRFEKHDIPKDHVKYTTDYGSGKFYTTCELEKLKETGPSEVTINYTEYNGVNETDIVYPQMEPIYEEDDKGALSTFSLICNCPPKPTPPDKTVSDPCPGHPEGESCPGHSHTEPDYEDPTYLAELAEYNKAIAEHATAESLISTANGLVASVQAQYKVVQEKKKIYDVKLADFNAKSQAHAISVVKFYNALQDYYTAAEFDMESMIHDASFRNTSIYDETFFYTRAAYEYKFDASLDGEKLTYRRLFSELLNDGEADADTGENPTIKELRLYYELWQNYAKYATNLPQSGKYINWWTPEVQLLFLVGGSYRPELNDGKGLKISDEYRLSTNPENCPICSKDVPEYDNVGQFYYDWMSTWAGDDYTGRDITTATEKFFHEMISGGFDDGSLQLRTEYAYAYYYMFQYGTPYQKAIAYTSVNGQANDIMNEMIAEGRWQTNSSNTLSDTAMPHNDKWKKYQTATVSRQWEIDTSTSMSSSLLATLGKEQSHSKVNLLENIWNGCRYVNVIDNSTIGNAAIYLTDNPLIYADKSDPYYIMKYGDKENSATEPVSSLYKVVYNVINQRLSDNGKPTMGGDDMMTDGFTFVKTAVLWSGLDKEFENITNKDELSKYLQESTSSIWNGGETYKTSTAVGSGNTKIWEQRKLGPYYNSGGGVYYKYKWYLVPRVLNDTPSSNTGTGWYDGIREDEEANKPNGDHDEDLDSWYVHHVDEHDVNNMPSVYKGYSENGYVRDKNDNGMLADWVRVDWECWDPECAVCHGKGGHGDTSKLLAGDIIIGPTTVGMWLGESTVQSMYPTEINSTDKLVYVGGNDAQKIKSMSDSTGFTWSKPCSLYVNHDTECIHTQPTTSLETADPSHCEPYYAADKWTVYRLSVPNYTDDYRSAGVTYKHSGDDEWEIWYKYRYKGMEPSADTKEYLHKVREDVNG